MKNQTKILFTVLAGVILLVAGGQLYLRGKTNNTNFSTNENPVNFNRVTTAPVSPTPVKKDETVTIDFGNRKKVSGNVYAQTAYEALEKLSKDNNLSVEIKQYKFGKMVTGIGTVANSQDKSWLYFVNGQAAQIAADRYVVHPGDAVEWKYGK